MVARFTPGYSDMVAGNTGPVALCRFVWLAMTVCILLLAGCDEELDTTYGRRTGYPGEQSVNGTAVLAELFGQAGHRVSTWRTLSPGLRTADTIVWAPDNFNLPTEATCTWLDAWLAEGGRTLIYIDRDYDAAPHYWQAILPRVPTKQAKEVRKRARAAQAAFDAERSVRNIAAECIWFETEPGKHWQVTTLAGPWSKGINAAAVDIELNSRMVPPDWSDVLLAVKGDVLVSRETWDEWPGSQMIVVANGSFLLNMPLVNKEHRKLVARLVEATGSPGKVVFLESQGSDPEILEEDPAPTSKTGLEAFSVWPVNYVLLHVALLGLLFAYSRWPIFGLPRPGAPVALADFGRHVRAMGEMLRKTGDRRFAHQQIDHYHQLVHGEPAPRSAPPSPLDSHENARG